MRIAVIGGDERSLWLSRMLRDDGHQVSTLGLAWGDGLEEGLRKAELSALPYPFSVREGMVPNLSGRVLPVDEIMALLPAGCRIVGAAGVAEAVARENAKRGQDEALTLSLYSDDERFTQTNAEISAEGAIAVAMRETEFTLMGAQCLVTGYGLFGRALAQRLLALGARVRVAARREEQRLQAASEGMRVCSMEQLSQAAGEAMLVLNTVPARLFTQNVLDQLAPDAYLYELASKPYGIDLDAASEMGLRVAVLPGIPAKYAPKSAAQAMMRALWRGREGERA